MSSISKNSSVLESQHRAGTRWSRHARPIGRCALGAMLLLAGISHLSWARQSFQAQVPTWFPIEPDIVVIGSGIIEVAVGSALILLPRKRVPLGWTVAAFFTLIFPGNVSQMVTHTNAFGLDSDLKRIVRLAGQPVLVLWALWSTGAWREWRASHPRNR